MYAYEHAYMCKSNSGRLYVEYGAISPIFRCGVLSKTIKDYSGLVYCHPGDKDKEYIEDFKYTYCDL